MFQLHSRVRNQFVILPPAGLSVPRIFRRIESDSLRHNRLLMAMQRLRGKTYVDDGAIRPEDLTPDGRHQSAADERAWHVLSLNGSGQVSACLRFLDESHSQTFRGLWVSGAAMARCPRQGWKLRLAVESKLQMARSHRLRFGSVGGWAAAPEERRTMEPVAVILATYGLLELLGGCIGVATATVRHHSSTILRKIGLTPLSWRDAELPSYFDPQYGCDMEILQFQSSRPNSRYSESVERLRDQLASAPVVCREFREANAETEDAMAAVA